MEGQRTSWWTLAIVPIGLACIYLQQTNPDLLDEVARRGGETVFRIAMFLAMALSIVIIGLYFWLGVSKLFGWFAALVTRRRPT